MSVRSSFFDALSDVYSFSDSLADSTQSRADSPVLGSESNESFSSIVDCSELSHSLSSVPPSPLPPSCPPTRRYSRQASGMSSLSSVRNAVYADPELEESLHETLGRNISMQSAPHQAIKSFRPPTSTYPHIPSSSISSSSEIQSYQDCQDAITPTAPHLSTSRRSLTFGPIATLQRNFLPCGPSAQLLQTVPCQSLLTPYNPSLLTPLESEITLPPSSAKRYSSDDQSDMHSPPSSPPFSRFPSSLGSSSHLSTPNTSPHSTWSRANGRRVLDTIIQTEADEIWGETLGTRWNDTSSDHELPNPVQRESRRIFGQSVEVLATIAKQSSNSYQVTLSRLEGQDSSNPAGSSAREAIPRTPKKRQRLRSFISRLSYLHSPKPHLQFGSIASEEEHKRASFNSFIDGDPFRAPDVPVLAPSSPCALSDMGKRRHIPSNKRVGNRSRVKSFFFQS